MTPALQPFLSDAAVVLRAPTQAWSRPDGEMGAGAIDGVFHGDTRFIRAITVRYDGRMPEWVAASAPSASAARFDALLRGVDDHEPDPKVRLVRERRVTDGSFAETLTVHSHLPVAVETVLEVRVAPDASPLQEVKAGADSGPTLSVRTGGGGATIEAHGASMTLAAPGAEVGRAGADIVLRWPLRVDARGVARVEWSARFDDPSLVVRGAAGPRFWADAAVPADADPRLRRWTARALGDLDALRLVLPDAPEDEFLAAGTPWFFTLFGRDSLWAARLLLSVDATIAASTLRVLARLQGTTTDPATAEQPGKIPHELRAGTLALPGEGIVLPPLYYGTVDATPLWVSLLAEAAEHGMPERDVRELLPALHAALGWIRDAAGESGFLDYVDETGHGLSNQGWKDSGDSIQWRAGALAEGPIALSEVQGYAYEAAVAGAALLDRLGEDGGDELRAWAADLKARFRERFWVTTPEGTYPGVALDRHGRAVDTLTSNIGHLLGTGILDPDEERQIADLLVSPAMSSGFGLRTMSTGAAGYWPLSYHGGSVWAHDTAIVARGMARAGLRTHAATLVEGLLAAAEAFGFRMPELHAGDAATETAAPAPYPAACRPQAWSAAAAVVCLDIVRDGLDGDAGPGGD